MKSWYFDKISKVDNTFSKLIKRQNENTQIIKISNEKGDVTIDTVGMKKSVVLFSDAYTPKK